MIPLCNTYSTCDMGILRALMVSGFFNPLSSKWGIGQNVILVDKGPSMAVTHAFRAIRRIEQCLLVCGVCMNMPVDCIPACGHVVCRGCASQVSQCPWCAEEVFWCAEGEDGMWKATDIDTWLTLTRGTLWAVMRICSTEAVPKTPWPGYGIQPVSGPLTPATSTNIGNRCTASGDLYIRMSGINRVLFS